MHSLCHPASDHTMGCMQHLNAAVCCDCHCTSHHMQLQLRFSITVLSSCLQQLLLAHMHVVFACPYCELELIQVACYALPWACMAHQKGVVLYAATRCTCIRVVGPVHICHMRACTHFHRLVGMWPRSSLSWLIRHKW